MAVDPFVTASRDWRWFWATAAFWCCLFRGQKFVECLRAPDDWVPDFFQEYASARNHFEGLPVYASHWLTMKRYLGWEPAPSWTVIGVNAHPPSSVLLAFPLVRLDFPDAFLAWNILSLAALGVSLWLLARGLNISLKRWVVFPVITLSLLCNPLLEQLRQGQLNLALLLLITGVWGADRSERTRTAGILLGLAAAIKLFPGFLIVYFLARRRWGASAWAVATFLAVTVLTIAVLGADAYRDYFKDVLPVVQSFRGGWDNSSLIGYWTRLFDTNPNRARYLWPMQALWEYPTFAWAASAISIACVTSASVWAMRRRVDCDLSFALALTAMLLVTPIVWEHYFLVLTPSLVIAWCKLPPMLLTRGLIAAVVFALWLPPHVVWRLIGLGHRLAGPLDAIGLLSYQFYALVALFLLLVIGCIRSEKRTEQVRFSA